MIGVGVRWAGDVRLVFDSGGTYWPRLRAMMEDGGKAPLAEGPKRPTIVVASFSGAVCRQSRTKHALYSSRAKALLHDRGADGVVPKLRELVCSYMDGRTLDHG